jgi:hypothetical protein
VVIRAVTVHPAELIAEIVSNKARTAVVLAFAIFVIGDMNLAYRLLSSF